jgi:hypothetical protein
MRLIYYSAAFTTDGKYDRQWIQSIRSLRVHNSTITVYFFVFDHVSDTVRREAERCKVTLHIMGPYRDWMKRRADADALSRYRTLHKLLVPSEVSLQGVSQILYVDCDTFFFDDPNRLFEKYSKYDWCSREIPGSRLSPHGVTANINEALIAELVSIEGLQRRMPFNTGVCLLNNEMWSALARIEATFLDFAWRLVVGMFIERRIRKNEEVLQPPTLRGAATNRELNELRMQVLQNASQRDTSRALPYPSDNWWVLDEIAWLLALGRVGGVSQAVFSPADVAQGDESLEAAINQAYPLVAHYFSHFEKDFFRVVPSIAGW